MGRLIYASITSLDGYVADAQGNFDWSAPDEEVHAFVNDLERGVECYLYGRRLYEVMRFWETFGPEASSPVTTDYAQIWKSADKVVYSATLEQISSERTRIERQFDTEAVRRLKTEAASNVSIGGPTLAATALRAGLVDEIHQFLSPVVVGGGRRFLPDDITLSLSLQEERRFGNGVVFLSYLVRSPGFYGPQD